MEIFVFVRMGGQATDMVVHLLDGTEHLATSLTRFDAGKANCFLDRDKQRLIAVIEASFGTFTSFNQLVRRIFKEQLKIQDQVPPRSTGTATVDIRMD